VLDELGVGAVPLVLGRIVDGAPPLHAVDDLLAEAAHRLMAGAVVHGEEEDDQAAAGEATEVAEAFNEHDLSAVARGGGRRR